MTEKLAIDGGTPVRTKPYPRWPVYYEDQIEAVASVLRTGLTHPYKGVMIGEFEKVFAAYCGVRHAVAANSGTSAIHMALAAADIGPGDEVIVPPRTFVGTVSPVIQQNAVPVFADVDRRTHNMSPDGIRAVLTDRTRAIIPVHLAGCPCEMDDIMEIARKHDLLVVEDCAQAHGAEYRGRKVGSIGQVNAFSFQDSKILTTAGDGGMMTTDDDKYAEIAGEFRSHGFLSSVLADEDADTIYIHPRMGYNYRITELNAAVGLKGMARIEEHIELRRRNAHLLTKGLAEIDGLAPPYEPPHVRHTFYRYYVTMDPDRFRMDRNQFMRAVKAEGILCDVGTSPELYNQEIFKKKVGHGQQGCPFTCNYYKGEVDYTRVDCPNAHWLGERCLCFEVYPTATPEDMADVLRIVHKVAEAYRT